MICWTKSQKLTRVRTARRRMWYDGRMKPSDPLDDFNDVARRIRDTCRPTIEHAAMAIGIALEKSTAGTGAVKELEAGPERWSWKLPGGRTMTLAGSGLAGAEGHPLLSLREEICEPLDNQICTSALVIGRTTEQIVTSALTLLMNHTAAVAGLTAVARVSVLDEDAFAEIDRIRGDGPPPFSAEGALSAVEGILAAVASAPKKPSN